MILTCHAWPARNRLTCTAALFVWLLPFVSVAQEVEGHDGVQPALGAAASSCAWSEGFHPQGIAGGHEEVAAMTTIDPGDGPKLIAAGSFRTAGTAVARHVAQWDGSSWRPLAGPSGEGIVCSNCADRLKAVTTWDDGTGPAVYVAGAFTSAGGVPASDIAKWDGTAWSALAGPSGEGISSIFGLFPVALASFDDGSGPGLYIGATFTMAGGLPASNIARWDGTAWSSLAGPSGEGVDGAVQAMTVFDDGTGPALYVAGSFGMAGGITATGIARWDGTAWSAVAGPSGQGLSGGAMKSLTVYDDGSGPALYAAGDFSSAGGKVLSHLAKWDGADWSAIGPPGTEHPELLAATLDDGTGPALYGMSYDFVPGQRIALVARWSGVSWEPLSVAPGTGFGTGGSSTPLAGLQVSNLSTFDPGSGPAVVAAGDLMLADGALATGIARWNGSAWTAVAEPPPAGLISKSLSAFAEFDDGSGRALYAGGRFQAPDGGPEFRLAKRVGDTWQPVLGSSGESLVGGDVLALSVFDDGSGPSLFAAGQALEGVGADVLARWDGTTWTAADADPEAPDNVWSLAVFDDGTGSSLFVAGDFANVDGFANVDIARWDGASWSALIGTSGEMIFGQDFDLAVFDDGAGEDLYVAGIGISLGAGSLNIARWDGSSWSALSGPFGDRLDNRALALAVFDDGTGPALFVAGWFTEAGGVPAENIARWDGDEWSALGTFSPPGFQRRINSLAVLDDGTGPALYAGGDFASAGGVAARNVARWDGTAWSALRGPAGNGTNSEVVSLGSLEKGPRRELYAGGRFTFAGGVPSTQVGLWRCSSLDLVFADGFESGDLLAWTSSVP